MANAKIVVTLGPASDSSETICALIRAGASIFRLNASHGAWSDHQKRIEAVRDAENATGIPVATLLDLQGPKIRLGRFKEGKCVLRKGARFTITTEEIMGDETRASTIYPLFAQDVKPGNRVLLNDGAVTLRARSTDGVAVEFDVISGGPIGNQKGINLPGVKVSAPSMTEKDIADLQAGVEAGVDFVALSFVRTARDVQELRQRIGSAKIPIIAKIEKPDGVDNIEEILEVASGIMVARGDLGVEMSLEMVPPIQKNLIRLARKHNRFVITATQMLESMIENANPTRAEVSDVANAIYDGTDAVMLSAETSVGKFPVAAVDYMTRIAAETERGLRQSPYPELTDSVSSDSEIVARAAVRAAHAAGAQAIVVFTEGGYSARLISRYRPPVRIIAMTNSLDVVHRLLVNYAVTPVVAPEVKTTDQMLGQMDTLLVERGLLCKGDKVIFVAGTPVGSAGSTNLMKLHRVS
jgi:pyruvate kinase